MHARRQNLRAGNLVIANKPSSDKGVHHLFTTQPPRTRVTCPLLPTIAAMPLEMVTLQVKAFFGAQRRVQHEPDTEFEVNVDKSASMEFLRGVIYEGIMSTGPRINNPSLVFFYDEAINEYIWIRGARNVSVGEALTLSTCDSMIVGLDTRPPREDASHAPGPKSNTAQSRPSQVLRYISRHDTTLDKGIWRRRGPSIPPMS